MSVEENKAVIRRHVEEVFNRGDLSVADEIISADYVFRGAFAEYTGPEGFKQLVTTTRTAFPDIHYVIDDMVGEGDILAVRYTATGTFKGELAGISPTNKRFTRSEAIFYRFKDGKEAEAIPFSDMLTLYQQLGISPPG